MIVNSTDGSMMMITSLAMIIAFINVIALFVIDSIIVFDFFACGPAEILISSGSRVLDKELSLS